MRLGDNPFKILGVTPIASLEEIDEAASDKSFIDADNEELYNNARMTLSSPNKRLSAEVRWFFVDSAADIESMPLSYITDKRERLLALIGKRGYSLQEFANAIISIDKLYEQACSDDTVSDLRERINDARLLADITGCEFRQVKEAVVALIEDIGEYINEESAGYNEIEMAKIGNTVANEIIKSGRMTGVGFEKFINVYNVNLRIILEKYREEIVDEDIPELKDYCDEETLNEFCAKVRNFDYLAQPLQVFLLKQGRSDLQEESIDIAKEIRSLAIYFHNEEGDSETTLALLELENELFSELPEIHEKIKGDISAVNRIKADTPPEEFVVYNRLPYEGGLGQKFQVLHGINVRNAPRGEFIGNVMENEIVTMDGCAVFTHPRQYQIKILRDYEMMYCHSLNDTSQVDFNKLPREYEKVLLRKGEILYFTMYTGEGTYLAWYKGKIIHWVKIDQIKNFIFDRGTIRTREPVWGEYMGEEDVNDIDFWRRFRRQNGQCVWYKPQPSGPRVLKIIR